jgi:hypothetical protein
MPSNMSCRCDLNELIPPIKESLEGFERSDKGEMKDGIFVNQ